MSSYDDRYEQLNAAQQQAVDYIDGPLLVIAGPGTGKTELLSMRTANILRQTDTLAENILCLTFTDSGANAMRERLSQIIGPDAYRVAIHTFHSFGTEVINQNAEYFYHGAKFKPADELSSYELLTQIFDELDYTNPLSSKLNGEYTHLRDTMAVISELKQSGLSSDELLAVISGNEFLLDTVEPKLAEIFDGKISLKMIDKLVPITEQVAHLDTPPMPVGITPLSNVLALSMAHAFEAAIDSGKTTPITAWRNEWLEKNRQGTFVFKARKRHEKLRAVSHVYFAYLSRMEQACLYDFDDMILGVVHGIETQPDLKFNLQEKYHYIMVDEFQDTNLAQLRILFNLTDNPAVDESPNIMAVGDDDQAIYSFQGADVNNIHAFRNHYEDTQVIALTDNYRSVAPVISHAREVITQGAGRLETTIESLNKQLTPHYTSKDSGVMLHESPSTAEERAWIAADITKRIKDGATPSDITVIARRHSELIELLPYLYHHDLLVNYERRDNVLDMDVIQSLELIAHIAVMLHEGRHDEADSRLPQLLAHPAFHYAPELIWHISLASYRNKQNWMEILAVTPETVDLRAWLVGIASRVQHDSLEVFLDELLGTPKDDGAQPAPFVSPLYEHYFSAKQRETEPDAFLVTIEALRTIRQKLREYRPNDSPHITDFLEFIRMHRQLQTSITSVRRRTDSLDGAINLMTAHKSKGLEYGTVYIIGAVDNAWGERVRSRSRLIGYPENLNLAPAGNTYDERVRLFFVAMTRAKRHLVISYAARDDNGKDTLPASFLTGTSLTTETTSFETTIEHLEQQAILAWHDTLTRNPSRAMRELLLPQLETYKLSATHLNHFIDITRGGPSHFLLNNLLHFPQAKSASASFGTAVHATLQRAHTHLVATGGLRPVEDVLGDFETELTSQHLSEEDFALYHQKGIVSLTAFLKHAYSTFSPTQKVELSFGNQAVIVDQARLTGALDLVDIKDKTITVTDYKTGKPSRSWKGTQDYEKVKLHKYKQQLMFYQLLIEHSRDYSKYTYDAGILQFVEPDVDGIIHALQAEYTDEEFAHFRKLIAAVWRCITTLELPATDDFDPTYKGVLAFEQHLIDKYTD